MQKFKKIKYLSILIIISVFVLQSQSFNILDERIKLKDYNYNLTDDQNNNNYYNFCKTSKVKDPHLTNCLNVANARKHHIL